MFLYTQVSNAKLTAVSEQINFPYDTILFGGARLFDASHLVGANKLSQYLSVNGQCVLSLF